MALTPENAMALLSAIWPAALKRVEDEVADMQQLADSEGSGITIAPWDYRGPILVVRTWLFLPDLARSNRIH